jgi:superfamily II DNA or RNA helicase
MERLGNRFGLVVFDECHHLPGPTYRMAADACLAPYRLGLTATPEREDGGHEILPYLIGPIVYRREIKSLAGEFLSEYETIRLRVRLSAAEKQKYQAARKTYTDFLRNYRIAISSPGGWGQFLMQTSRSEEGRQALFAYREQKAIAQASSAKIRLLEHLLRAHRRDRVLIFTGDNETVYRISRRFLIPAITHQSKVKERKEILEKFNEGTYPFLVTSRVLNEGVDVPEANVAVILSGSGSVMEHVQRLGRILRRREGKRAVLYEVVTEDTAEESVSRRRRRHSAYGS